MTHIERFLRVATRVRPESDYSKGQILDFGCGSASAIAYERSRGLNVSGCDLPAGLERCPPELIERKVVRPIGADQAIPFDDLAFDMVVSHMVLEHVGSHEKVLSEIKRVLKTGGLSIHIFPSRLTPIEPHTFVPLATVLHSRGWLWAWAFVGIRNEYQKGLNAVAVASLNKEYLASNTRYLSTREYRRLASPLFPNVIFAEKEFLLAGNGVGPRMAKIPFVAKMFGRFVHNVLVMW